MFRVGIIGCGSIAQFHAKAIRSIPEAELVGGFDLNEESARRFAAQYDCRAFSSVDALLDADLDAVCVCTPSGLHAEFVIRAAKAGKNVLTEKPIATTLEDADAMIAACEENHVILGVISQLRFAPHVQLVKQTVDSGKLGKLLVGDVVMKYYRDAAYFTQSPWRGTWAMNGGGALINQGIHGIDLLLYLVGKVRTVTGICRTRVHSVEVEDTAAALLEFENGAIGTVTGTTSVYPGIPRRLSINGSAGSISLTEENLSFWDVRDCPLPDGVQLGLNSASGASDAMNLELYGHVLQHQDFIRAVREHRSPLVSGAEARKALQLVTAIYRSNREHRTIDLD